MLFNFDAMGIAMASDVILYGIHVHDNSLLVRKDASLQRV